MRSSILRGPGAPRGATSRRRVGRVVGRELGELGADLVERQADPLGEDDERDPPQHGARIAAVARAGALGRDQAALLVEAERRGRHAAAPRDLADGEEVGHVRHGTPIRP